MNLFSWLQALAKKIFQNHTAILNSNTMVFTIQHMKQLKKEAKPFLLNWEY